MSEDPQLTKAHSQLVVDEHLRLGWQIALVLRTESGEPYEWLLKWVLPGPVVWPDWSAFQEDEKRTDSAPPEGTHDSG